MQNCGMPCGHYFEIVREADTIILHFAFSILHLDFHHGFEQFVQPVRLACQV